MVVPCSPLDEKEKKRKMSVSKEEPGNMPDFKMWVHNFLTTLQFSSLFDLKEITKISWWNKNMTVIVFIMICQHYDNLENNLYNMIRRYQNILKIYSRKRVILSGCGHLNMYPELTVWFYIEIELQVHKYLFKRFYDITRGNINSAFHGLDLAAVHEQEKWYYHFCCDLELREGETFS